MPFEIRQLSWHKRRRATEAPQPLKVEVPDFQKIPNHFCDINVTFDNGEVLVLHGRVSQNQVNHSWSVNGINGSGQSVFAKWVENDD